MKSQPFMMHYFIHMYHASLVPFHFFRLFLKSTLYKTHNIQILLFSIQSLSPCVVQVGLSPQEFQMRLVHYTSQLVKLPDNLNSNKPFLLTNSVSYHLSLVQSANTLYLYLGRRTVLIILAGTEMHLFWKVDRHL